MITAVDVREQLLAFVYRDLIGPAHGPHEDIEDSPKIRYGAGVLFPQNSERNESEAVGGIEGGDAVDGGPSLDEAISLDPEAAPPVDEGGSHSEEATHNDTVTLANSYRPSAMGLSFTVALPSADLVVQIAAAEYKSTKEPSADGLYTRTVWHRRPLSTDPVVFSIGTDAATHDYQLTDGLKLRVVIRPYTDAKALITVSIYNTTTEHARSARTFYQTGFDVLAVDESACFVEYRTLEGVPDDDDDTALAMLYRKRYVFAIGHGCAADWEPSDEGRTTRVATDVLPRVLVPPVLPLAGSEPYLNMQFLAGDTTEPPGAIPAALLEFCDSYQAWIEATSRDLTSIDPRFHAAGARHLHLCEVALDRMRAGVALLRSNARAFDVFKLVNRVMLKQQYHSRLRRKLSDTWVPLPDDHGYAPDWTQKRGYWRAFQLAFILVTLPSLLDDEATVEFDGSTVAARDIVDLIWFPTGGGKTEAYLAATAFVIFLSRMIDPDRDGCRVLMRYTLRLLTSQQFQRAASMICACELERRADPTTFGSSPIAIGLWVGMSLTPNDETVALQKLTTLDRRRGDAKNPFQLLFCPWCGTELDNAENLGYAEYNRRQIFLCPNTHCPFAEYEGHLPICVVDESIYARPPSLIIGTVDKFAMLAWRDQAGRLFTVGNGPDLIIQDELHLISGPLGSMVGLYEGVIDYLCTHDGRRPKIIASTATIRRADIQCRALYDRPMLQFPPPGLDASDSFFAKEDPSSEGRVYVGFLPTASSSPLTAQIRSVVALQQGAVIAAGPDAPDKSIDPYFTLVQYFGSLKELGRAATFLTADIPEFLPTMHRRYDLPKDMRRYMNTHEELTSRKNDDEIPKIIKRLEMSFTSGARLDEQALDTILATNMISVGVDIDRLGLMMIVTQPKGTSEYIQASSRVGRSDLGPGLIFTLYSAGRPRDRSHYEQFRAYHESFYRFVEPTSVTPFAPPALARALHAVLVIAARHIARWKSPTDFRADNPAFVAFLDFLRNRVRNIDPEHVREFEELLQLRLEEWGTRTPGEWGRLGGQRDDPCLMRIAGTAPAVTDPDSWETPTSMRNVDVECSAEVIPRYNMAGGAS